MFKVGDLVRVKKNTMWYDFVPGTIGKVISVEEGLSGVDFKEIFQYAHNLDGRIKTNTGLYLYNSALELYKSKGGNYNEY